MLGTLIFKELRVIVTGPKFVATFAACGLLLLLSMYIGIGEYRQSVEQHHISEKMSEERLGQAPSWHSVRTREHRTPDPLQIFASGLHYDIGRWSPVDSDVSIKLRNSIYSDDPLFAVFRILDFTIIVQVVFSLFALLFTFNAVNGEKERGTLRLVFANAVPRVQYLLAKGIGAWLGLVIPLLIPIMIGILMIVAFGVPLAGSDWVRIAILVGVSLTYLSLFVVVGLMMSTVTARSNVSFLLSLVIWIAFVLIIPRAGVMAAGHIAPVPRLAQIEGLRDGFAQDQWDRYYDEAESRFQDSRNEQGDVELDETEMWASMEREDSIRAEVRGTIEDHERRLMEDLENRRRAQQRIGFTLARVSPAAAYQLAAMTLAGTDITLKRRYNDAMSRFRDDFLAYVQEKSKGAGPGAGAIMIEMDSEKGMTMKSGRDAAIDVSDRPRFESPELGLAAILPSVMIDTGLLAIFALVAFAIALVRFLRFDVR